MRAICALVTAALCSAGVLGASPAGAQDEPVRTYIVVLDRGTPDVPGVARAQAAGVGVQPLDVYQHALSGYSVTVSSTAAQRLARNPRVKYVVPSRSYTSGPGAKATSGSPGCATQTSSIYTEQCVPEGVRRVRADSSSIRAGDGRGAVDADIAILDTGVDSGHPELNVAGGVVCNREKDAEDYNGHGTHVAGTAAARDNGQGVVGVAPGARIWSVKVLSKTGIGSDAAILCGIDWVTANADRIEVANMSLGGPGEDDRNCGRTNRDPVHEAICASVTAGVTYTVAAGNEASDAATHAPAAYDEVITVSALADYDGKPGAMSANTCGFPANDDSFTTVMSNYGSDVDVMAPGACVWSTYSRLLRGGFSYARMDGTSMAAPHVAGAAALLLVREPNLTPAQVRTRLRNAGSLDWTTSSDPDGTPDPLLDVSLF